MTSNKSILWINYLKAISIIGVFFVHCNLDYGYDMHIINSFLHPFYVNAFFFVSGYLLFRKQLSEPLISQRASEYLLLGGGKTLILNILFRLIIPSTLFAAIEFIPSHLLRGMTFDIGTLLYKTIGGCTYWFTSALVVAELLILLMLVSRKRSIWFYLIASCVIYALGQSIVNCGFTLFDHYPSLPWHYQNGMFAVIFLAVGGVYWKFENYINRMMNKYVFAGMIVLYIILLMIFPSHFKVLVSMLDVNIAGIFLSILATVSLIELCKRLPQSNVLNYIGQNTIGFYFMSGALPIVLSMLVHKVMPESNALGLAIVFTGSIGIAYVAVYLMNRFIPWVFDLRTLKRN